MADRPTALVAGGTGFLGRHLVARLAALGWRVRATVHHRPAPAALDDVEWVRADLTRRDDCRRAVDGIARVFMCAANSSGAAQIVANPLQHVTPNVVMNAQLLDAAYAAGVDRFVFLSSSVVYPATGSRPVCEEEAFAGDPYPAYHGVGWMKRYTEILCEMYARRLPRRMPVTIVRPANVYGPGDKFDLGTCHVTSALIRKVVERRRPLEVWGTGDDVRDLLYVDDFVDGLLAAAALPDDLVAVNLGTGTGVSVRQILETILAADGFADADVRFAPDAPRTIPARVLDVGQARARLGFAPRVSLREGIRRTIAWYRAQLGPAAETGSDASAQLPA